MRVLVTGWRRGIGEAVASMLEREGDTVVRFEGDVTRKVDWDQYEPQVLDGLVNCAGVPSSADIFAVSPEEMAHTMAVNFHGPVLGMQTVLPGMVARRRGSVVNVTSIYAEDSGNGRAVAYHASKAALSMVTRNAAKAVARQYLKVHDVAQCPVRVNEVRPGFTHTRMALKGWNESRQYRAYVMSKTLAGGMAARDEIASVIAFLLSEKAAFVTGASWSVDGGWLS